MLSQMARTYSPLLVANTAAVVLLSFRNQLVNIGEKGTCNLFFTALKQGVKPYYILTMVKLVSRILSLKWFTNILPPSDWQIIANEGNDFFMLPLLLYMCSVGIVWLASLGLATSMILCESTIHKTASKILARTVMGAVKFSDWFIGGFHKLPCFIACILISLSIKTCGSLAICLGCGFYYLKLTHMSQDYVESLAVNVIKYFAGKFRKKVAPEVAQTRAVQHQAIENVNIEEAGVVGDVEEETETVQDVEEETRAVQDVEEETKAMQDVQKETEAVQDVEDDNEKDLKDETQVLSESKVTEPQIVINVNQPTEYSSISFHFSIFMLWCIIAILSVPSLLTWARNFKYSPTLQFDPFFLPGFILSACAIPLWQMDLPKTNIYGYQFLSQSVNLLAAAALIYAPISIYRLNYLITGAIVLIILHQCCSPNLPEPETVVDENTTQADPQTKYTLVKEKWE